MKSNPYGRKVKCIYFVGDNTKINVGIDYDTMLYELSNLGDYGIEWVKCYRGDKLAAQYNMLHIEGIEFAEEEI